MFGMCLLLGLSACGGNETVEVMAENPSTNVQAQATVPNPTTAPPTQAQTPDTPISSNTAETQHETIPVSTEPVPRFVEVIPPTFGNASDFAYGMAVVANSRGRETGIIGIIDRYGNEIVPIGTYDFFNGIFDTPSFGLAQIQFEGKRGFVDNTGRYVISPTLEYTYISSFSEGRAMVLARGVNGPGVIDTAGNEIVPPGTHHSIFEFSDGMARILGRVSGEGFINIYGYAVIPPTFSRVLPFSEGLAAVRERSETTWGLYGFIDTAGNEVISHSFRTAQSFSEGRAIVTISVDNGHEYGVIDSNGNIIVPFGLYEEIRRFSGGMAAVTRWGEGWGFIDTVGNEVVSLVHEEVTCFSNGLAGVRTGRGNEAQWGFVNNTGELVIPQIFNHVIAVPFDGRFLDLKGWRGNFSMGVFSEGFAVVRFGGEIGVIDTTGDIVVPFGLYDDIRPFSNGLAAIRSGNSWGFIAINN